MSIYYIDFYDIFEIKTKGITALKYKCEGDLK
jgi:hypothetical protein